METHELTWQDVKRIVNIADAMVNEEDSYDKWESEEAYYKEVLKRYNEEK